MARRRAAFLDRDGVLNIDFGYVADPERLVLVEGAASAVRRLNRAGYLVVVVSNQSGVARGYFGVSDVEIFHEHLRARLASEGAYLDALYWCPFHPDGSVAEFRADHEDRKPRPGMILRAMKDLDIDESGSFLVGDKISDIEAAEAAGIPGHLFDGTMPLDQFIESIVDLRAQQDGAQGDGTLAV